MDILIKGMEMPKDCISCPFFDGSWCKAQPIDNWRTSNYRPSKGERQVTCPLVALPEHGRLISDTDVKALFRSGLSLDTDSDIDHVCGLIDGLPTIVEATNGSDN